MIVRTGSGVMLHGELARDPEIRSAGQKQVLKFDVKARRVQNDAGKWETLYVQVNVWRSIDQWDGMLKKDDSVTVYARKLEEREYNGKTYYNVDADDIVPGGLVIFRWMQDVVNLCSQPVFPSDPVPTNESTPFDEPSAEPEPVQTNLAGAALYPGEALADYAPPSAKSPGSLPSDYDPINDDSEDLPF